MSLLSHVWNSPLLTTFANTTFLFLCVAALICAAGRPALAARLARSPLVLAILLAGTAAGVGSRILIGYLGPGDIFQEFLGATELAAGRSMNPTNGALVQDRVAYWFGRDPLDPAGHLPARLRTLEKSSIDAGARQIIVQAHPPFHVLLLAPLAAFGSIRFMYLAMTLINFAAYAALLAMIWRLVPETVRKKVGIVAPIILALGWQPFIANLRQGQIGVVVALLVVAGWFKLEKRAALGGALIGLAALIKMFPALLLVWLAMRNRRAFVAALGTILIAAGALYFTVGWSGFVQYADAAKAVEATFGQGRMNYSLGAVVGHLLAGPAAPARWMSVAVLAAEAILFLAQVILILRAAKPSADTRALEFGGFIVLSCLFSPTCWAFYYPVLLLPLAFLLRQISTRVTPMAIAGFLLILCCLSAPEQLVGQLTTLLTPWIGNRSAWLLCSFPTFAMLASWY